MNREKGFTLIELLGVVALLALLSLLASVPVTKHMQEANQKACEGQLNNMVLAAKQWGEDHKLELPEEIGTQIVLSLAELKSGGYIEEEFKNPITRSNFSDELKVIVTKEGKRYWSYDVVASDSIRADQIQDNHLKLDHELIHDLMDNSPIPFASQKFYTEQSNSVQNELVFSGACFSIVNIAQNGSLKLVYEGAVSSAGNCKNVRTRSSGKIDVSVLWNNAGTNEWLDKNTVLRTTLENLQNTPDVLHIRTSDMEKLEDATFYIGKVPNNSSDTLKGNITEEQNYSYKGKIGTLNVTDYVKICASNQYGPNNVYQTSHNTSACALNYLQKDYSYWFMNASSLNQKAWYFTPNKILETVVQAEPVYIRPVVYLKANTYLTGSGTSTDPFRVDNQNICKKNSTF